MEELKVKSKLALVVTLVALALGVGLVGAQAAVALGTATGPGAGNDVSQDQSANNNNSATQTAIEATNGGNDPSTMETLAQQVDAQTSRMLDLANTLKSKYDLCEVAIAHRTGRVEIGDASVAIAVSAPHRHDALAACKEAIDTLKASSVF